MKLNTDKIEAPYIDAEYYTNIFKPNKNAMITGSFNNVESHIADFDALLVSSLFPLYQPINYW